MSASVVSVVINVLLSLLWLPSLGARGLLLANAVSQLVQTLFLLVLVRRLVAGLQWRAVAFSGFRVLVASLAMAGVCLWTRNLFGVEPVDFLPRMLSLCAEMLIAITVFLGCSKVLHVDEVQIVWASLVQKMKQNVPSVSEAGEVPIA